MTIRQQQIESTLKRTLSEVISRRLADPRIRGLVSITRVEVTNDLKDAHVYVSVLPAQYEKRAVAGLNSAAGHIHRLARDSVALKTTPHFEFRLDESLKKQAAVLESIDQAARREDPTP